MSNPYPIRDALIDVLDRYDGAPSEDVMDALLAILVAQIVSEGVDPERVWSRARAMIRAITTDVGSA